MHQLRLEAIPQTVSAETVYVIDNSAETARYTLGLWLASAGYNVEIYTLTASFLNDLPAMTNGCVILDVQTSEGGPPPSEQLTSRNCHLRLIVVVGRGEIGYAVQAMKAGAIAVIEKPYSNGCVLAAVSTALAAPPLDLTKVRKGSEARARLRQLSSREFEVLRELVAGRPNKVVGYELNISPRTVEIHRANMMKKLRTGSLAEAVRIFVAGGLDDWPQLQNPNHPTDHGSPMTFKHHLGSP